MIYYFIEKETIDDEYSWITVLSMHGSRYRFKGILDKEYALGEQIHLRIHIQPDTDLGFTFEVRTEADVIMEKMEGLTKSLNALIGAQKSPSSIAKIQAEAKFIIKQLEEIL